MSDSAQEIFTVPVPSPRQLVAIRGYFDWTQKEAADRLNVYYSTLRDFEKQLRPTSRASLMAIGTSLQAIGVKFEGDAIVLPP